MQGCQRLFRRLLGALGLPRPPEALAESREILSNLSVLLRMVKGQIAVVASSRERVEAQHGTVLHECGAEDEPREQSGSLEPLAEPGDVGPETPASLAISLTKHDEAIGRLQAHQRGLFRLNIAVARKLLCLNLDWVLSQDPDGPYFESWTSAVRAFFHGLGSLMTGQYWSSGDVRRAERRKSHLKRARAAYDMLSTVLFCHQEILETGLPGRTSDDYSVFSLIDEDPRLESRLGGKVHAAEFVGARGLVLSLVPQTQEEEQRLALLRGLSALRRLEGELAQLSRAQ